MACTDLEKAKRDHDQYVELRIKKMADRINALENALAHTLDVIDKKAEPCDWIVQDARRLTVRIRS